jgi:hypothetical protein
MAITKTVIWNVTLNGVTEILFDRYAGDNKVRLAPEQKFYSTAENELYLPSLNIMSFLSATNTESAPKLLLDKREYKQVASAILSSVQIAPNRILFLRKNKPIKFGSFDENGRDTLSGVEIVRHVARLDKGIPNVKERPMLGLDWALKFKMTIFPNPDLNEDMLENLFVDGGARLGLGTFRKAFGKFNFRKD